MGVKRSSQFVNKCKLPENETYMPEIVIVDACHIMHRICRRKMSPIINSHNKICTGVYGITKFVLDFKFKYPNSKLVFIFDGKTPKIKHAEVNRRKDKCKNAKYELENKISNLEYNINIVNVEKHCKYCIDKNIRCNNDYGKMQRNSYNPLIEMGNIKIALRAMGIKVVQAINEADSVCAYYSRYYESLGKNVTVITQDIDILLLGAGRISMTKNISLLEFEECKATTIMDYFKNTLCDMFDINICDVYFDIHDLHSVCCLMGTELCPSLRIFKEKLTLRMILLIYIVYDRDILKLLESLKKDKEDVVNKLSLYGLGGIVCNVTVDDDYINRMMLSLDSYRNGYFMYSKYYDYIISNNNIISISENNSEYKDNEDNVILDVELYHLFDDFLTDNSIENISNVFKTNNTNFISNDNDIIPKYIKVLNKFNCECYHTNVLV